MRPAASLASVLTRHCERRQLLQCIQHHWTTQASFQLGKTSRASNNFPFYSLSFSLPNRRNSCILTLPQHNGSVVTAIAVARALQKSHAFCFKEPVRNPNFNFPLFPVHPHACGQGQMSKVFHALDSGRTGKHGVQQLPDGDGNVHEGAQSPVCMCASTIGGSVFPCFAAHRPPSHAMSLAASHCPHLGASPGRCRHGGA